MFKTIWLGLALCGLTLAATTTTTPKRKTAKKTTPSASVHSAHTAGKTAAKTTAPKSGTVASKSRTGKGTKSKRVVRSYQQAPTPERYKEIQQALIDKGYLHGEANGQWGPDSTDALRRFQADQNITADGKIGALSLIALGLGPKRLTAQTNPQPAGPPAPASPLK
ncbi:MAG TPA: peptidoglycan-binding domain-containing protein [Bryobacteraceae bacterium]|nr:peptidoglycan-binding domain-containing protein [Bryobacteraceae bacterium]